MEYHLKYKQIITLVGNNLYSFSLETLEWKHLLKDNKIIDWQDWSGLLGANGDCIIGYKRYGLKLTYTCYDIKQNDVRTLEIKYLDSLIGLYCTKKNKYHTHLLIYGFIRNIGIDVINAICDIIIEMYNDEYIEAVNQSDYGISINKCPWNQFISNLFLKKPFLFGL